LKALRTQIAAACPGDATIGLAPGADALRTYVAQLGDKVIDESTPTDDIHALEETVASAKLAEATAAGLHEVARAVLSKAETNVATAVAELSAATRETEAALEELRIVREEGDGTTLDMALTEAQRERAAKLAALETAREGSIAFNLPAIARRLDNLDRAAHRCGQERLELTAKIAALESSVIREGTSGPAGRVADAFGVKFESGLQRCGAFAENRRVHKPM
jgi:multidrug efflux pump subunit AcrA (membrane-fusion protein)